MCACISPADVHLSETISTLRYASRARCITNTPTVNSARRRAELGVLRQENEALRDQIRVLQDQLGQQAAASTSGRSAAELQEALAAAQAELEAERAAGTLQEARLTQLASQLRETAREKLQMSEAIELMRSQLIAAHLAVGEAEAAASDINAKLDAIVEAAACAARGKNARAGLEKLAELLQGDGSGLKTPRASVNGGRGSPRSAAAAAALVQQRARRVLAGRAGLLRAGAAPSAANRAAAMPTVEEPVEEAHAVAESKPSSTAKAEGPVVVEEEGEGGWRISTATLCDCAAEEEIKPVAEQAVGVEETTQQPVDVLVEEVPTGAVVVEASVEVVEVREPAEEQHDDAGSGGQEAEATKPQLVIEAVAEVPEEQPHVVSSTAAAPSLSKPTYAAALLRSPAPSPPASPKLPRRSVAPARRTTAAKPVILAAQPIVQEPPEVDHHDQQQQQEQQQGEESDWREWRGNRRSARRRQQQQQQTGATPDKGATTSDGAAGSSGSSLGGSSCNGGRSARGSAGGASSSYEARWRTSAAGLMFAALEATAADGEAADVATRRQQLILKHGQEQLKRRWVAADEARTQLQGLAGSILGSSSNAVYSEDSIAAAAAKVADDNAGAAADGGAAVGGKYLEWALRVASQQSELAVMIEAERAERRWLKEQLDATLKDLQHATGAATAAAPGAATKPGSACKSHGDDAATAAASQSEALQLALVIDGVSAPAVDAAEARRLETRAADLRQRLEAHSKRMKQLLGWQRQLESLRLEGATRATAGAEGDEKQQQPPQQQLACVMWGHATKLGMQPWEALCSLLGVASTLRSRAEQQRLRAEQAEADAELQRKLGELAVGEAAELRGQLMAAQASLAGFQEYQTRCQDAMTMLAARENNPDVSCLFLRRRLKFGTAWVSGGGLDSHSTHYSDWPALGSLSPP